MTSSTASRALTALLVMYRTTDKHHRRKGKARIPFSGLMNLISKWIFFVAAGLIITWDCKPVTSVLRNILRRKERDIPIYVAYSVARD